MTVDARIRELESGGPLRYGAWVHRTTDQSISATTITPVTWSAAVEDDFAFWSGASTTARLRVPVGGTGIYLVDSTIAWDGSTSVTSPQLGCYVYDITNTLKTLYHNRGDLAPLGPSVNIVTHETWVIPLAEREEIEPWVYHASAGARNIEGGSSDVNSGTLPRIRMYRFSR